QQSTTHALGKSDSLCGKGFPIGHARDFLGDTFFWTAVLFHSTTASTWGPKCSSCSLSPSVLFFHATRTKVEGTTQLFYGIFAGTGNTPHREPLNMRRGLATGCSGKKPSIMLGDCIHSYTDYYTY
ncbi:unnamed protein product, partial [Ectocarpus sp. 13 AM-2016]